MPAGVKIRNINRTVVIDGIYKNMAFIEKRQVNVNGNPPGNGGTYRVPITVVGTRPMLATYCPGVGAAVFAGAVSGNSRIFWIHATQPAVVEVFIFDVPERATFYPINYGLKVRNPDTREVVFDSRCPYMRVVDFVYKNSPSGVVTETRNYAPGMKVAVLQSKAYFFSISQVVSPGPNPLVITGVNTSVSIAQNNSVTFQEANLVINAPMDIDQAPIYRYASGIAAYLVLNVTGI